MEPTGESTGEVPSIRASWERVESLRISSGGADETCEAIRMCEKMVEELGLFSSNEELDDVQTRSLRYLILPFYKADALQQYRDGVANAVYVSRLEALEAARLELERFMSINDRIGILDASTRATYLREGPVDAGTKRAEKVARFTREKALRQKLQGIKEARRARALRRVEAEAEAEAEEEEEEESEEEREKWMVLLRLAHNSAIDMMGMLDLEIEMLRMRVVSPSSEDGLSRAPPNHDARTRGAPPAARDVYTIPGAKNAVAPGTLHFPIDADRTRIASTIFRPSHQLPTKTLEQFAMEELADARARDERHRATAAREEARKQAMTVEERDDEEVYKARGWDEFKDDNPTGWGNSKLRPCA